MKMKLSGKNLLVLDVGTTGVKAFVFDKNLDVVARIYKPLKKYFPKKGPAGIPGGFDGVNWVEQKPQELLLVSKKALREAVRKSGVPKNSFLGLGVANQRETTILWDKKTGRPAYPAIVWEDTRTKKFCAGLQKKLKSRVRRKTGLSIDPYFSASKIWWILQNIPVARQLLRQGRLAFGTVDSWILWNFLNGSPHITDYTNASRTLLFNIKTFKWDKELLEIFQIPAGILPKVKPSQSFFGDLRKDILGFRVPVLAVCGDQQASMYAALQSLDKARDKQSLSGQADTQKGVTKATYGTGTFIMQILGLRFRIREPFFTTIVPGKKRPIYALEAKIDCCGKKVESVLDKPKKLKAALTILTKVVNSHLKKLPQKPKELIVDGGVSQAEYLISTQANISGISVQRQKIFDGTALGSAKLMDYRA